MCSACTCWFHEYSHRLPKAAEDGSRARPRGRSTSTVDSHELSVQLVHACTCHEGIHCHKVVVDGCDLCAVARPDEACRRHSCRNKGSNSMSCMNHKGRSFLAARATQKDSRILQLLRTSTAQLYNMSSAALAANHPNRTHLRLLRMGCCCCCCYYCCFGSRPLPYRIVVVWTPFPQGAPCLRYSRC
jgi:hypothetical protein